MSRNPIVLSLLAGILSVAAVRAGEQTPHEFSGKVTIDVGYRYLLSLPDGYDADKSRKWPLIVFLHGAGERGDDLELLKKHGPPKLIAEGKKIEAIVASPQCPAKSFWNPYGVKVLTDQLVASHRVDTSRIYLTGLSMGGFGTWETVAEYPDTYAAIVPICGGAGVRRVAAEKLKDLPIWIFHGDQDASVSVDESNKIHAALVKVGSKAKLTIYPGVPHDSWTRTYENPEVWEWLFAQKRTASSQ